MVKQIFVNLPVKDLKRSIDFFTQLGFKFDARFTNENATSMILGEDKYVMLLVEPFFASFTPKKISDSRKNTEVIVSVSVESREKVDELVNLAFHAGAGYTKSSEEQDGMYGWGFQDLDGHMWEVFYMDESAFPGEPA